MYVCMYFIQHNAMVQCLVLQFLSKFLSDFASFSSQICVEKVDQWPVSARILKHNSNFLNLFIYFFLDQLNYDYRGMQQMEGFGVVLGGVDMQGSYILL